jgi:hypothetical protein
VSEREGASSQQRRSAAAGRGERRTVPLPVEGWAYEELAREAERNGMSVGELASFAIAYYLADADSGRIARRIPTAGFAAPSDAGRPSTGGEGAG